MINLNTLELINFLSHVNTKIDFNDYKGLVLIEGINQDGHYSSNGSGKSTLLEGIVYALTGNTLRGVSVNDVVNRNYKKDTKVSLSYSNNNDTYDVSRYRKDTKYGDSLLVSKNSKDVSKRLNKDTQKSLDDSLGLSYKVLTSTMLLGEGLSSRFTQLSDPEKKSLIESTLSLNYDINKIRDKANNKLKELKLDHSRVCGEISVLENLSDKDVYEIQNTIEENKKLVESYRVRSGKLKYEYDQTQDTLDLLNTKIRTLKDTINKYNNLDSSRVEILNNISSIDMEISRVLNSESPTCSVCHQPLVSEESKKSTIDNYRSNRGILENKLSSIELEMKNLPNISILKNSLDSANSKYLELRELSNTLISRYNESNLSMNNSQNLINQNESILRDLENCNQELESKKSEGEELIAEIEKYEYFYKLFSPTGIIVDILSEAIEYINIRLATYSEVLLEKEYKLSLVKGKINIIDSRGSTYQSLSAGEKKRLDISIQFSLHDYIHTYCGSGLDTLFIDEVMDALDDIGIENILTVLRMKLEYCKLSRIFVVSHNPELKSYFDNVVTVQKKLDGNSYIQG